MIVDAILYLVTLLLNAIISILPGMPPGVTDLFHSVGGFVSDAVAKAAPFNNVFPLFEASIYFVVVWSVMIPAEFVFNAATWIWARIPVFGGGS